MKTEIALDITAEPVYALNSRYIRVEIVDHKCRTRCSFLLRPSEVFALSAKMMKAAIVIIREILQ